MPTFLTILHYLWGPIVGAVIGYLTNLIAVKMMFHPYKPWRIGKLTLPFTPGIIPKRQGALARAIGNAVSRYLFTGDDLRMLFLDSETKEKMVDLAMNALDIPLDFDGGAEGELNTKTAYELAYELFPEQEVASSREKLVEVVTNRAMSVIQNINLGNIIAEQGSTVLLEKKASLGMAALFINETTLQTFLPPIAEKINEYIAENGRALVEGAISNELDLYANKPLHNLLKHIGEEQIRAIISATYERLILGIGQHFTDIFDIGGVVETKVNAMTPRELEALVLAIMKRELSAIVNLGAVIGFVLGLFNMLNL